MHLKYTGTVCWGVGGIGKGMGEITLYVSLCDLVFKLYLLEVRIKLFSVYVALVIVVSNKARVTTAAIQC